MQMFSEWLSRLDAMIGGSQWFVFLLLGTGLFFTLYLRFPQFRYFGHALKIVRGKFDKEGDQGDTSHFQALTTALSGTVGTGNIAGVALAIHLGGPAALFWMLVTAFLGMTTKFVEVTLSHKYREKAEDGTIAGGPMFYMKHRLNIKTRKGKLIKTGYWMGALFAVATIFSSFGTGSLPQINSISNSAFATFGINKILTGAILSVLLGFVIIGGIKRIAKVTARLVPMMAVVYFVGAFAVIFFNFENIGPSMLAIVEDVFSGTAATGGFLGAGFAFAFNRGVNRGLFSNEAGQGSAPIAHAAARAHEPVSEGMVALLEPFIDTIIICTVTGLTLLSSGVWTEKIDNRFQDTDLLIFEGHYSDENSDDIKTLKNYLMKGTGIEHFDGQMQVSEGRIVDDGLTVFHARSIAENVKVYNGDQTLFTGMLEVNNGKLPQGYYVEGKSLIHSAPLTTEAFARSWFGNWGRYIVTIGLLLFAFSTAISWSYYGGRAVTYLFGIKYVMIYRVIYVIGFFLAAFVDTTIVWIFSGITIAFMTIPNLVGILILRREMKNEIDGFWGEWDERFPKKKLK